MDNKSESSIDLDEEYKAPLLEKIIGDRENQDHNYDKAITHYLLALDKLKKFFDKRTNELAKDFSKAKKLIDTVGIPCHLNLSLCYLKLSEWNKCIYECDKVLQMDKTNTKALFRRSKAYSEINEFIKAKEDFQIVQRLLPNSSDVEGLRKKIEERESSHKTINKSIIIDTLTTYAINNPLTNLAITIVYRKPKSICTKATQLMISSAYTVKYISIDLPLSLLKSSINTFYQFKDKLLKKVKRDNYENKIE